MGSACSHYTTSLLPAIWKDLAGSWCCLSKLTCLMTALARSDICCNQCNSSTEVRSSKKRKHAHVSTLILADQLEKPLAGALKYPVFLPLCYEVYIIFSLNLWKFFWQHSYFLKHIWNIWHILSPKLFLSQLLAIILLSVTIYIQCMQFQYRKHN